MMNRLTFNEDLLIGRKNQFHVLVNWTAVPAAFSNRKSILVVDKNAARSAVNIISMVKQFSSKVLYSFL